MNSNILTGPLFSGHSVVPSISIKDWSSTTFLCAVFPAFLCLTE